jgi:hypothetical protein
MNCQEKVAKYDAMAPRRRAARRAAPAAAEAAARPAPPAPARPAPPAPAPAPAPLAAPAGFRLAASSEGLVGPALVGQTVLYRWPVEGWVRGTVTARSRAAGFSHVVRYGRASALGFAVVPSLLVGRGVARPGRPLGAPLSRRALAWLPFSRTTVMGRRAGCRLPVANGQ